MSGLIRLLIVVAAALAIWPASAHVRSQSYSHWTAQDERLEMRFTIDARRATLLYAQGGALPLPQMLAAHLEHTVSASPCVADGRPQPQPSAPGWLTVSWQFHCPAAPVALDLQLRVEALFGFAATHVHVLSTGGELPAIETALSAQNTTLQIDQGEATADLAGFLRMGAAHVASGWDHIAFLAALLLLVPGWKARLLTVTGFTLGHSLTLALTVAGLIRPDSAAVEALIGFSVAYAAIEAAMARGLLRRRRATAMALALALMAAAFWLSGAGDLSPWLWLACVLMVLRLQSAARAERIAPALAAAFGLIHGAGFAGALLEISLPQQAIVSALIGFNLGVELGQLMIVLVLAAAGWAAQRVWTTAWPRMDAAWPVTAAMAVLTMLGSAWFIARA